MRRLPACAVLCLLAGCATCERHPDACHVAVMVTAAVIVGGIAESLDRPRNSVDPPAHATCSTFTYASAGGPGSLLSCAP